jgi:hypothetical protein
VLNQAGSKLAVIERLIAQPEAIFIQCQPKSAELAARARGMLAGSRPCKSLAAAPVFHPGTRRTDR